MKTLEVVRAKCKNKNKNKSLLHMVIVELVDRELLCIAMAIVSSSTIIAELVDVERSAMLCPSRCWSLRLLATTVIGRRSCRPLQSLAATIVGHLVAHRHSR